MVISIYFIIYKSLYGCAFIRELHVYGSIVKHNSKNENLVQHKGFGKKLLEVAENISFENNYIKIAIISGVGVREYYENRGYILIDNYMVKEFKNIKKFDYFEYSMKILIFTVF